MQPFTPRPHFPFSRLFLALLPLAYPALADAVELDTVHVQGKATKVKATESYTQGYGAYGTSTATGMPMTLRQTPQNISIVSAQQIDDQNLTTLGKVVEQAVGLYTDTKGSKISGYTVLYARGNKVENFQLDGMPINIVGLGGKGPGAEPNAWSMINTAQYDRIEVLRGATALMDGSGQPSATISLHRKRPTADFQGNVALKAGSDNLYGVQSDLSGSLNQDKTLRGRLVGAFTQADSFQDRSDNRNGMLYGITEWDISDDTTFTLGGTYQYMRDRNSSMFGLVLYDTNGDPISVKKGYNATINGSYVNYHNINVFTELTHRLNENWTLKAEYGYIKGHRDQVAGVVGSLFVNRAAQMGAGVIVRSDEQPVQHNFTLALNGHYDLWGRQHDAMFGLSGYDLKSDQPRYQRQINRMRGLDNIVNFNGDYTIAPWVSNAMDYNRIRQLGGYGATRLYLTDKLAFIAGGRYTAFKVKEETQYINGNNALSSFTPYVGVVYDLTNNISLYSSYAQIFKPQTKVNVHGEYLNPEKGSNTEVGLKGEFFDQRLNGSLSLFETRKSNVGYCAHYSQNNALCDYYDVDAKVKARGFELEINGAITDNWAIMAGLSYAKAKTSDGMVKNPEVPRKQAKLFTSYQWQKLMAGVGLRWQSEINERTPWGLPKNASGDQIARSKSVSRQKAYAVVDAMVRYRFNQHADFTLNVENLLNKRYRTSPNSHSYGLPRTVVGTLSVKF
ncbi:TonB-dependent siderophore receptor [Pasteurellaceae bacterium 20609_3]|uniref:TonB-dependent siderophore receptor n=1 Tax=Spirabiliibacterium mucosae TaxID=28156 RepID=UPI001AAC72B1|nr:TonB-dependent siderophore receptor [Spirabiliibacterium mucosae]MBE2897388.1 TonB-dependent siderophore receptor [Spirabiliibacterium mucosae]